MEGRNKVRERKGQGVEDTETPRECRAASETLLF